jgi:Predicted membrane protein
MPHSAVSASRLLLGAGLGLVLALLLPHGWPWEARALLGWNVFCAVNLLRLLPLLGFSPEDVTRHATREDDTRALAAALTLAATLVSLVGVFVTLGQANHSHGLRAYLLTGLAVLTVALSWLLVQAEYTLHYARRFYSDGAGIRFIQRGTDDPLPNPDYFDFLYLSLTIGMTYQVSDTNLDTREMRRLLLAHAALSYFFSVVIIAVTVSGVAGLLG